MIDEKFRVAVEALSTAELVRAYTIHSPFADYHHAYAVIKEEVEETEEEMILLQKQLNYLWYGIKKADKKDNAIALKMKGTAIKLALEAIQVAAMAQKIMDMK